jgi:hypothetical protein
MCDFGLVLVMGCRCGQDSNYYTRLPASLAPAETSPPPRADGKAAYSQTDKNTPE